MAGGGAGSARGAGAGVGPAAARLEGHCWASSLPTRIGRALKYEDFTDFVRMISKDVADRLAY